MTHLICFSHFFLHFFSKLIRNWLLIKISFFHEISVVSINKKASEITGKEFCCFPSCQTAGCSVKPLIFVRSFDSGLTLIPLRKRRELGVDIVKSERKGWGRKRSSQNLPPLISLSETETQSDTAVWGRRVHTAVSLFQKTETRFLFLFPLVRLHKKKHRLF